MIKLLDGMLIVKSNPVAKTPIAKKPNKVFSEREKIQHIEETVRDAAFLDWENPQWNEGGHVHNWHNYAPPSLQIIWDSLSEIQKQVIAQALDRCASEEDWD